MYGSSGLRGFPGMKGHGDDHHHDDDEDDEGNGSQEYSGRG